MQQPSRFGFSLGLPEQGGGIETLIQHLLLASFRRRKRARVKDSLVERQLLGVAQGHELSSAPAVEIHCDCGDKELKT